MYNLELNAAIQAVKNAEKIFLKYHGTKTQVEIKGENYRDLVSLADKTIEKQIKDELFKEFPNYGFIGEESEKVETESQFSWILDPIDGTTNYLQGLPDCCISLALLKNNEPVLGVVYAPVLNKMYEAVKGQRAKLNGKVISVTKTDSLKNAFGAFGWGKDINFAKTEFPKLLERVLKIRVPGSAALAICYVAEGLYDFFLGSQMKLWDYAAAKVILENAGGEFVIDDKKKIQSASNPNLVI